MTDEIAQNVGPDFETAADLIESIREDALEEAKATADQEYLYKVVDTLVEMSDLDYPPVALELEIDRVVRNFDLHTRQIGLQGIDHFLEMSNQTIEEYRETLREGAEKSLRHDLVLDELAQRENFTVSDEEFEEHIGNVAGPLPEDADEETAQTHADMLEMMRADHTRPLIDGDILKGKSTRMILAIARGEELPPPAATAETPLAEPRAGGDSDQDAQPDDPAAAQEPTGEAAGS